MPIISPWIFYYNSIYEYLVIVGGVASFVSFVGWFTTGLLFWSNQDLGTDRDWLTKMHKVSWRLFWIALLVTTFLPSGEALIQMAIANVATTDNIEIIYETLTRGF